MYRRCLYNVSVLVGAEYRYGYRYIYDTHAIHILDTVRDTVAYLVLRYVYDTSLIQITIHIDDTGYDTSRYTLGCIRYIVSKYDTS